MTTTIECGFQVCQVPGLPHVNGGPPMDGFGHVEDDAEPEHLAM